MLNYGFTLLDNKTFIFSSDKENIEFLNEFIKILNLEKKDKEPYKKFFFISSLPEKEKKLKKIFFKNLTIYFNNENIFCKLKSNLDYDSKILVMENIISFLSYYIILDGGFFLHSGLIQFGNKGILLAGGGGFGKSTVCKVLSSNFKVLCDDELILLPYFDKYVVHPLPTFSDYLIDLKYKKIKNNFYSNVEDYSFVSFIFILQKSKENKILPLSLNKSLIFLYNLSFQVSFLPYIKDNSFRELKKVLFSNILKTVKDIPVFLFKFNNTEESYKELKNFINEEL